MQRLVIPFLFVLTTAIVACGPTSGEGEGEGEGEPEAPTFTRVKSDIFELSCSATACHDDAVTNMIPIAAGIDLESDGVYGRLVDQDASTDNPGWKLVVAGDPDNSLLYQVILDEVGTETRRMPADELADMVDDPIADAAKELLRAWIEAGALDD